MANAKQHNPTKHKETVTMKTTKITLAKRAALIAVLVLGSSSWLSAQTDQGRTGQSYGSRLDNNGNIIRATRAPRGLEGSDAPVASQQESYAGDFGANNPPQPLEINQSSQPQQINKGSSLIGTTVKNQQGENLGKITDLVIDFDSERVSYVVLDSGAGILNARKLHAVPLRAFQPDAAGTSLILNTDKAKLDSSQGFANNNWPSTATGTWGAEPSSQDGRDLNQQKIKEQQDQDYKVYRSDSKKLEPKETEPAPRP